jgi:hypothetical protein
VNKKTSNDIKNLLRFGKTIVAPVEIGQYPAQGKVIEFSCTKNMQKRIEAPVTLRRGYTA